VIDEIDNATHLHMIRAGRVCRCGMTAAEWRRIVARLKRMAAGEFG
jgi:hypothetical protein